MDHGDAVALALLALRGGTLRYQNDGWWALGESHAQQLPHTVVDRLRAERLIEASGRAGETPTFRLTKRGEGAAAEAAVARSANERAWNLIEPLRHGPLLTLRPADHAEDVDRLLILRVDEAQAARHRQRIEEARRTAAADDAGDFDFAQYRVDVWSLPIHDAAIRLGLLPGDEPPCRLIPHGLEDPDGLGARWCPDRGINYGARTVQVFGGLGPEDPLTVSPAIDAALFEAHLPSGSDASGGGLGNGSAGEPDPGTDLGVGSDAAVEPGRGPLRTIRGFHRDEEGHWVADLSCGHGRHVRDDPPWVERPWVRSEEGRASRLGAPLRCARCADGEPVPPAADADAP